ncbi:PLC-like phosphodiesterase, partial [Plenodomus tracheiphilus IPT5]
LTVRNLTSIPISIKCIERFQDPNTLQSKSSGYFGASHTSPAFPTSPALGEHSQNFTHQDLDVTLRPFEAYTLASQEQDSMQTAFTISNVTLRLTLETLGGERYRVDTHPSYTQKSKHALTPLSPSPSASYSALFHPSSPTPHLTIHSNHQIKYETWMADFPDTLPLSAMSIPGTHNSHTHYRALPSVRCQHVDIKTQLENGIRFLDIRLQPAHSTDPTKKDLYLVHGAFPVSLTGPKYFEPILQTCYDFLSAHPTETILISLKREGVGSATDQHLAHILETHYITPQASKWYTSPTLPYLGAARGKLILLRRYNTLPTSTHPGLDLTPWPHNATHATFPPPTPSPPSQFCLQDYCEVMLPTSIPDKVQHANDHLVRAAQCI